MSDMWPEKTSLDDKLREILKYAPDEDGYVDKWSADSAIAEIKQAFADEGYLHVSASQETQAAIANTILGHKVMTGQEWYDRFEKELGKRTDTKFPFTLNRAIHTEVILEAAKKAAGL